MEPRANPQRRRTVRLQEYDYATPGAYFVTICTFHREGLFGDVADQRMRISTYGETAVSCWREIPRHFPFVVLDEFVVMPNHIHGIIVIQPHGPLGARRGAACCAPTQASKPRKYGNLGVDSLAIVVRSFKSAASRQINLLRQTPATPVWQRNDYEHVVRNEDDVNRIRQYIVDNPARWSEDEYYRS